MASVGSPTIMRTLVQCWERLNWVMADAFGVHYSTVSRAVSGKGLLYSESSGANPQ